MKVFTTTIDNENYIQIFLTKDELNKDETQKEISKIKKTKDKVAIFISGEEKMIEIIKQNINYTFANT